MLQKVFITVLLMFTSVVLLQMGYSKAVLAESMMGGDSMGDMMQNMPGFDKKQTLPDKDSSQALVYTQYCGQCHVAPSPQLHTAEEWSAVVVRMMQNISKQKKLMPDTKRLKIILDYVQHYAKKATATEKPK